VAPWSISIISPGVLYAPLQISHMRLVPCTWGLISSIPDNMPTHDRVAGRKITASWTRHRICIAEVKSRHSILYCTVLYCTALYCTVLHCTVLYCTVLYCTVLCCTVLLSSRSDGHSSSAVQWVRDMFFFITYCSSTTSTARHGMSDVILDITLHYLDCT
jgi:hypothetical protein